MKLCLSMCVFVCVRARYRRLIVFEMFNTLRRFYCGILRGPHVALNCVWLFFFFGSIKTSGWVGVHLFSGMFFSVHRWEQYISTHALFCSSPALKKVIKKEPCTLSHMVKWKSVNSRRLSIFNTDFNLLHNQKIFFFFVQSCFCDFVFGKIRTISDSFPLSRPVFVSFYDVLIARYPIDLRVKGLLLDGLPVMNLAWLNSFWCFDRSNKTQPITL